MYQKHLSLTKCTLLGRFVFLTYFPLKECFVVIIQYLATEVQITLLL